MSNEPTPQSSTVESSAGLPEPCRQRWQPLRCGLVNLYRFDQEEFRFEQGRLLLRGNNGTGKSRVLALQLPFLLDGEVTPSRLEPDRDPAKHLEWNLLLGRYDDRLGYTWIEFGRAEPGGPNHFLTLGCGMRAVQGRSSVAKWFFMTRRRIGQDVDLQTSSGHALTQDRLAEALGSEGRIFTSAAQYRQAIDQELFVLGEHRYEALVNLLIQLRQPQLSRKLDEQKLSDALSEALSPLAPHIIADVAESFRSLESDRTVLESFRAARRGAEAFLQEYRAYGQIAARRRADDVRRTHYDYETTQRTLRDAEAEADRLAAERNTAVAQHQDLTVAEQEATARVATLQSSPEMQAAQSLDEARQRAREWADEQTIAGEEMSRATAARQLAQAQAQEAGEKAAEIREGFQAAAEQALAAARSSGLESKHQAALTDIQARGESDAGAHRRAEESLRRAVESRLQGVRHVRELQAAVDRAVAALGQARQSLTQAGDQHEESLARQREAHSALQDAAQQLTAAFRRWADEAEQLKAFLPDDLEERLAQWCETSAGRCPLAEASQAAAGSAARRLAERKADTQQRLDACQELLDEIRQARQRAAAGGHEPPPVPHTRSLETREGRPGGPLWLVCDFAPGVSAETRAGIEAALEASGLLDAWVTPGGRLLAPDAHDTVLAVGTSPQAPEDRHLGLVLTPTAHAAGDPPAAVAPDTVAAVLRHIGLGAEAGTVWVAEDGRFQVGPLHGAWGKPAAEHVGPAAREAQRQRRLAELDSRLAELERQRESLLAELEQWAARQAAAERELAATPPHADVLQAHAHVAAAANVVRQTRQRVAEAESHVAECRRLLEQAQEKCRTDARDLGLADWLDRLPALEDAIHDYRSQLAGLWPRLTHLVGAEKAAQAALERAHSATEHEDRCRQRLLDARIKCAEAATRQQELEAAIGATVQEVMARLQEARDRLQQLHGQREEAARRQSGLETQLALAQQQVKVLEVKLTEHAEHRAAAVEGLKRFAATRLLMVAGVEIDDEDPAGWSTTRAVEVARAVESTLSRLDSSPEAWERSQRGIHRYFVQLQETLLPQGYQPAGTIMDDLFVVTVPFQGRELTMTQLRDALSDEVGHRQTLLDAREREVIENHLIGEVAIHLHDLIHSAERWVQEINEELTARPMSTGMALRFHWEPLPDGPPGLAEARKRLLGTSGTWSPRDREALGEFLQRQIQSARAESEAGTWQDFLFTALDYRKWHQFVVLRKQDGQWKRLTRKTHGTGSGGEKVIALVVPQFAAAAAHYRSASRLAPRLILLDEAFVGVDTDMRSKCMDLLRVFDLDFVMTSEREWGCYPTLPGLAIYQLATREGIDAVGVTRWVWNGRQRILQSVS